LGVAHPDTLESPESAPDPRSHPDRRVEGEGQRRATEVSRHRQGEEAGDKRYPEGKNNQPATPHTPASSNAQTPVQPSYLIIYKPTWLGQSPSAMKMYPRFLSQKNKKEKDE